MQATDMPGGLHLSATLASPQTAAAPTRRCPVPFPCPSNQSRRAGERFRSRDASACLPAATNVGLVITARCASEAHRSAADRKEILHQLNPLNPACRSEWLFYVIRVYGAQLPPIGQTGELRGVGEHHTGFYFSYLDSLEAHLSFKWETVLTDASSVWCVY